MNTTNRAVARDRKVILSTLWIFAILNYAYADIMTLSFNPVLQREEHQRILSGYVGDIRITQGFVLVGAILMETAIVMVLLSRVLPYGANRWTNILVGLGNASNRAAATHEDQSMTSPKRPARVAVEDKEEHRSELRYGAFSRVLPLPVGTSEKDITATYTARILEIRVPFD